MIGTAAPLWTDLAWAVQDIAGAMPPRLFLLESRARQHHADHGGELCVLGYMPPQPSSSAAAWVTVSPLSGPALWHDRAKAEAYAANWHASLQALYVIGQATTTTHRATQHP